MASALDNGNGNGKRSGIRDPATQRRSVMTPFGPDVTLYPPALDLDPYPFVALLFAVLGRAEEDARWLTALEDRPPESWTLHERRRHVRMLLDVPDPRTWLTS